MTHVNSESVALWVVTDHVSAERSRDAENLAHDLALTFITTNHLPPNPPFKWALTLTSERLELRSLEHPKLRPVSVDFLAGAVDFRRRFSRGGQMIIRALGGGRKKILDCTAGWGQDFFMMISNGCVVTALERAPVVYALLRDGVERAKIHDPDLLKLFESGLNLLHDDANEYMTQLSDSHGFDAAYIDPMFPAREKSALPKKEMRLLHELLEGEISEDENVRLVSLACEKFKRVVVKRPLRALPLKPSPSAVYEGESTRFDVYLKP